MGALGTPGTMETSARLALYLFGSPRIERDGQPVTVDTRKALALLAYLAVTRQRHSRDALAGLLWPEYDESHARATLRRTLSALNKALDSDLLDVDREHIGLPPDSGLLLDVDQFHTHLAACLTHGHDANDLCARCLEPLSRAAALYSDDFLAGFGLRDSPAFEDWQFFQREGLRREQAHALERLAQGRAAQRNYIAAIEFGRRWLALDRLHEPAHCALMRLYAWAGQRAAALHQYRECVQVLDRELGVAPLETTTQLYEAIKANQPPAPPDPLPNEVEARSADAPGGAMQAAGLGTVAATATATRAVPLSGRAAEWAALHASYQRASGQGHLLALEGEAGIGKTRLAEDFLTAAGARGAHVLAARCYPGETGLAYGPIVAMLRGALARPDAAALLSVVDAEALAEVTRLTPELSALRAGLAAPDPLESPGAQSRFLDGISKTLLALCGGASAEPRGVLFFDDVQWMDSATLDLLTYLARRLRDYPLFLLLTWRNAEVAPESRLRALLADAQRHGMATALELSRLGPEAIAELLQAAEGESPPDLVRRLYQETEGLPFFIVEYLAALKNGMLTAQGDRWALPGSVRDLLRSRTHAVGEAAAQVLAAAAVIGRSFDFETVRAASGRGEEETVAAVEELIAHQLVREVGSIASGSPLGYDFNHEKLRTLVYDETSLARRRLLHHRVAEALIIRARATRDPRALASRIADHYRAAGDEREAADYYQQAGEQARALFANAEALDHLQAALALGHPDAAGLHQQIGDVQTLLGEYAAALSSYETAAALVDGADPLALASIERKIAGVYTRRGEWERAESRLRDALDTWGEAGPPGERARALADWSLVARHLGHGEQAQELAERAFALASEADDPLALAQAHNMLGMLAGAAGRRDEAIAHLERSLERASHLNDLSARIAALNNLSLACVARGELERARALTQEALRLVATQGDRHREAALHNNLADILHALGDPDGAHRHIEASIAIYMDIGVEAGSLQPEIWKLTEW